LHGLLVIVDELMRRSSHPVVFEDVNGEDLNEARKFVPDVGQNQLLVCVSAHSNVQRSAKNTK
jgi:hypothetical protein